MDTSVCLATLDLPKTSAVKKFRHGVTLVYGMLLVLAGVNMTPYPIAPMLRVDGPLLVTIMVGAPMEDRRVPMARCVFRTL